MNPISIVSNYHFVVTVMNLQALQQSIYLSILNGRPVKTYVYDTFAFAKGLFFRFHCYSHR